ncbi:MAG: hypothetical protein ACYC2R_08695 [Burkholderiales bacterium]
MIMLSDLFKVIQDFLRIGLSFQAIIVFVLIAAAVLAYKIAHRINGPLWLGGGFVLALVLASQGIEKYDGFQSWVLVAVLLGVGRVCYERLLGYRR